VVLWDRDMESQFSNAIAEDVTLQRMGDVWIVVHADTGLFDLQCPSTRQDVLIAGQLQEVCGQFAQPPAGWTVNATLMPAGTALSGSEAEVGGQVNLVGSHFDGQLPPTPTFDGSDAELVVTAESGSGATLGAWARRFAIEVPGSAAPTSTPGSPSQTRDRILVAAKK